MAPPSGGIERIEARFHGNGFAPHRHDTYAIGMTLSGIQTFRYRGVSQFSLPGNVIVLHPDELHDGAAGTDEGLSYRMMYIPPDRLQAALPPQFGGLPFVSDPVLDDPVLARLILDALGDIDHEIDPMKLDTLVAELADGLLRHADGAPVSSAPGRPARAAVSRAADFLRDNLERGLTSDDLEEVTGLDRFTLSRQFRRLLGTSPHRYLVMRRLDRARSIIARGDSIAEAAYASGFADQAHLTRHFKRAHGMTPGRFATLVAASRA
ncbi:AraC family transcriptional regulator [Sinorhizobium sp. BG8]|nr:AraC family transcriptional regulator [Sinorhizobium sp. BG8]